MYFPPFLKTGDQIAMIAPSGVVDPEYVQKSCTVLENWGWKVILGKHVYTSYGRFAGTVTERLNDLQEALDRPDIQAIICARGGYGVVHLLEHLSFEKFKKHPKWLVGYSDISALHAAISKIGICSLHAPMTSHLAIEGEDTASLFLKAILSGNKPVYRIPPHPLNRQGVREGFTFGGNLAVLQGLRGTKYDQIGDDTILFVEDIGEKPYQIERMLYNLKLGGTLACISGLIVGKFTEYEEDPDMMSSLYELIAGLVSEYNYPVCFDFPTGHIKENYPLIESGKATLAVLQREVELRYY